jgi:anaerobic dimethyl sulfoxide reductase subunit A
MSEKSKETIAEKKVSRRSMLKWTGALAAAAVVGAVAEYGVSESTKPPPPPPISFKPPLSPEVKDRVDAITQGLIERHTDETITYASCLMGCQSDNCVIKVRTKDGIIAALETDDTINPNVAKEDVDLDTLKKGMVQQRTGCAIGRAWRKDVYSPTRMKYPLKLVGQKGDLEAKYVRISWTEALDTVAQKISEIKEKYGPYSAYGSRLAGFTGGGVNGWGDNSYSGTEVAESVVSGYCMYITGSSMADVFNTKLVILWGRHPSHCEEGIWPYFLTRASEQGIPFIVIDPRYTLSAEAYNAQWIPIKAGTDAAMMLAVANVLFKENLVDTAYVAQNVEPIGFQNWKDYVLGVTEGPDGKIDRTPEWAESICGVPAETIRDFAKLYGTTKPAKLYFGFGACRSMSTSVSRFAIYLQAMTGNLTIPGGSAPLQDGYWKNRVAGPWPQVDFSTGRATFSSPKLFNGPVKWMDAILLRDKYNRGEITKEQFNESIGNKRSSDMIPNVKLLVNVDILGRLDSNKRIRAAKSVDFAVSINPGMRTDHPELRYHDIILPTAEPFFEGTNNVFKGERFASPHALSGIQNYFIYCTRAIAPLYELRPSEWTWMQIAKRFGVDKDYAGVQADVLGVDEWDPDKWNSMIEQVATDAYDKWRALPEVAKLNPPTWEDFKKKPVFRYEALQHGPFSEFLEKGESPFKTDSGKLEMYNKFFEDPGNVAEFVFSGPPPKGQSTAGGCLGKVGPMATPLPMWKAGAYGSATDPRTAKYPLVVISPNSIFRSHSSNFTNPWLHGDCYRHAVWLNGAEAAKRGIKDGDLARVFNEVAELILPAYVTNRIAPGTAAIYHGGWYAPSQWKSNEMPDGIDVAHDLLGGDQNFLIEDRQPGDYIIGPTLDAGTAEVQKVGV